MSVLPSVLTSGVVAAVVTLAAHYWLQRPRADLRMARINWTLAVAERLYRAKQDIDAERAQQHWQLRHVVLLTNYGDGPAYDIRLSGERCRPRAWIADAGQQQTAEEPPVVKWPMWSNTLAALEPGESVSILVMSSPDSSVEPPVIEVSWPRLPRRGLGRHKRSYDLARARTVETGWPGKTETASD